MFFILKEKYQMNWIRSTNRTGISRSNYYLEIVIRSADQIFDFEIVTRSADWIFDLEILIQPADRIFDLEMVIRSADRISISRSNIGSADRITISRSNIRSADRVSRNHDATGGAAMKTETGSEAGSTEANRSQKNRLTFRLCFSMMEEESMVFLVLDSF